MKMLKRYNMLVILFIFYIMAGCGVNQNLRQRKGFITKDQHHIVLVTIDTLRADHLGCYKYQGGKTPNIDQLAKEGVVFEHAYTPTPITLPAHTSIMTGLYPQSHGVYNNATYYLSPSAVTLAEVLKGAGYRTAAFIGSYVLHSRYGLNQGFQLYNDYLPHVEQSAKTLHNLYDERKAEETTALAIEWLSNNRESPCFLWIHYFEPHAPYLPPPVFGLEYKDQPYDGEIAYVDKCLGSLIEGIKDMNIYDQTLFVVTSDHGEGLGEHEEMTHGVFLYDTTLHIPLIIRLPGIEPVRVSELCRIIDIYPTILEYSKLSHPEHINGVSLLPLIFGRRMDLGLELLIESRYASENFGWANLSGIRTNEWKYIDAPIPELYNIISDPQEMLNLWKDQPDSGMQLKVKWQTEYARTNAGKHLDSQITALTPEVREQMKSLGYVWYPPSEGPPVDPKQVAPLLDKLDKGVIYYTMGRYEEAINELKGLIELNPHNPMGHFHLGAAYFLKGNLPQAKVFFKQVTELDSRNIDAYNYMGYIHAQLNDIEEAKKAFLRALELNPNFGDGHYNLGIIFYREGDFKRALSEFHQATKLNPGHLEGFYNLGNMYLDIGEFAESERYLKKAIEIDPNHPQTRNSLGKLYNKHGEYEKAEKEFLAAISADATYKEALNNLASVHIHQKMYNDAQIILEKAIAIDEHFGDALYNLGVVYRGSSDFVKALEYLKRAEAVGFLGYELCFALGDTYLNLQQFDEARRWLRKAVTLNPDSWKAHFDLAVALASGRYDVQGAIEEYERVIVMQPGILESYINLGIIHFQQGKLNMAVQLWQQVLTADPDNIEAQINLGAAYIQMGLNDLAVETYKRALVLQPGNLSLYYNLAIAYLHQKKNQQAIVSLNQALKIDPGFEAGKKLLDIANSWGGE